jgi:hypothetical protein
MEQTCRVRGFGPNPEVIGYSGLMSAASIMAHHFSTSARPVTYAPRPIGVSDLSRRQLDAVLAAWPHPAGVV